MQCFPNNVTNIFYEITLIMLDHTSRFGQFKLKLFDSESENKKLNNRSPILNLAIKLNFKLIHNKR